ncbi:glycosyltransferase [Tumidithrix elongata RA019]|uniref:Glycosyltransferase n=1 Tax=Tumidithrix elongata BACA0141 TaxID=2716417 RepID=A0AAW9PWX2_9CYAN|nr:glycosyltransferase [Tumidithrix elongata RA019]
MVYFLIVNYYSQDLIQQLIESIEANKKLEQPQCFEVYIVNNSPDDTEIHALKHLFPKINIFTATQNLGFGGGCNLGLQQIYEIDKNALVWLINPDATLDPDAIAYVSQCFEQDKAIAILGTGIRDRSKKIWFHKGDFNPWIGAINENLAQLVYEEKRELGTVRTISSRWVSGCSLILNLGKFDCCPEFNSHYFLYYEDADLCERYYQQGYHVAVTEAVLVTHGVSQITDRNRVVKYRHNTFSKLYFLSQHAKPTALWLNLIYMLVKILFRLLSDRAAALGRWQGYLDFLHQWIKR